MIKNSPYDYLCKKEPILPDKKCKQMYNSKY